MLLILKSQLQIYGSFSQENASTQKSITIPSQGILKKKFTILKEAINNTYFYQLREIIPKTPDDLLKKECIENKSIYTFDQKNLIDFIKYCSFTIINAPVTIYPNEFKKIFNTKKTYNNAENFYCSIFKICFYALNKLSKKKYMLLAALQKTLTELQEWHTHSHNILLFAKKFYCEALNMNEQEYCNTIEQEVIPVFKHYLIALFFLTHNYTLNDIHIYKELLPLKEKTLYENFYTHIHKMFLIYQKKTHPIIITSEPSYNDKESAQKIVKKVQFSE